MVHATVYLLDAPIGLTLLFLLKAWIGLTLPDYDWGQYRYYNMSKIPFNLDTQNKSILLTFFKTF